MRSNRWMMIGAAVVAAGVLMLGMAYATSGVVHAGGQQIPCDATTHIVCTPTQTETQPTQTRLKTHTPTVTPTEQLKTATPVPTDTPAPTNTPKAASEAVSVKPPNTGSGDSLSGGNVSVWLLALGAMSVVFGGGAVLVGARRRS